MIFIFADSHIYTIGTISPIYPNDASLFSKNEYTSGQNVDFVIKDSLISEKSKLISVKIACSESREITVAVSSPS